MKPVLAFLAIVALAIPTVAAAQPQAGNPATVGWYGGEQPGQELGGGAADSAGIQGVEVHDPIVLARQVVRGPRGRGRVVVGPRGRVRTFAYRGRNLTVLRQPRFIYPRGFGYRRWRAGQLLPGALLAAPFFFLGYEALGLQAPPPGYRWVRYGPDVVLVNVRTREIEDVAYGAVDDDIE
jgi:Ni/Co efflux regulator RcnB